MNVFVLSTGRCGSKTFAVACSHMSNYTAGHESNNRWVHHQVARPYQTLNFPDNHIEVDNRLSWFPGDLEKAYGDSAFYVHLVRRREEVARSYMERGERSILFAFGWGILQHYERVRTMSNEERYEIALQYCDTVNANIEMFLRDKSQQMTVTLDDVETAFPAFWDAIGADGDLGAAMREWTVQHNATERARDAANVAPTVESLTEFRSRTTGGA